MFYHDEVGGCGEKLNWAHNVAVLSVQLLTLNNCFDA